MNEMRYSTEQKAVVQAVLEGHNVIVNAVAGSGKTTTAIALARALPEGKRCLIITYNKDLQLSTQATITKNKLKGAADVYTLHGFFTKVYGVPCHNDVTLARVVSEKRLPEYSPHYDVVILDECQDLRPSFGIAFMKAWNDLKLHESQLVVMGDDKQEIYNFPGAGADFRMLTFANDVYKSLSSKAWVRQSLSITYRFPESVTHFFENCVRGLEHKELRSHKKGGDKPEIWVGCYFEETGPAVKAVAERIQELASSGTAYSDIFILAHSVVSTSQNAISSILQRAFEKYGIPVSVPRSDYELKLTEDQIDNKVVFSSIHQAKGLEKKVVFFIGLDDWHYSIGPKSRDNPDLSVIPNEMYVALTRASEKLIMLYNHVKNPVNRGNVPQWINAANIPEYCVVRSFIHGLINLPERVVVSDKDVPTKPESYSVTNLTKRVPEAVAIELMNMLCYVQEVAPMEPPLSMIPSTVPSKYGGVEDISVINGMIVPEMVKLHYAGNVGFQNIMKWDGRCTDENGVVRQFLSPEWQTEAKRLSRIQFSVDTHLQELLKMTAIAEAYCSQYTNLLSQVKSFNWISSFDEIKPSVDYIHSIITDVHAMQMEMPVDVSFGNVRVHGFTDVFDSGNIVELKYVQELKPEHFLQHALYVALFRMNGIAGVTCGTHRLVNARTGEVWRLGCSSEHALRSFVHALIQQRRMRQGRIDDDEFLALFQG